MARKFEGKPCAYCATGISTSGKGDHVIARGFFPADQRTDAVNPILVPACQECNNTFAPHEQALIALFTLSVDAIHPAAQDIAKGPVLRSAAHKRAKANYRRSIKEMQPVELYSPGGIYVADSVAIQPEYAPYDIVLRKIVKGLYYHHFQSRFPFDYEIAVFNIDREVCDQHWETMQRITCNGPFELADGVFRYAYSCGEQDGAHMLWLMSFYQGIYFNVLTDRPKIPGDVLDLGAPIHFLQPGKYILLERTNEIVTLSVAAASMDGSIVPSPNTVQVAPSILAAFRPIGRYTGY